MRSAIKVNNSAEGHGRVVSNIFGRTVSSKYGANSSWDSSAVISGSSGCTVVTSDSRVLSSVRGMFFFTAASSPNASASLSRWILVCRFLAFFSRRYLEYISDRLSLFLMWPGLLVTGRFSLVVLTK